MAPKVSAFGKRKPSIRLVGCIGCHKVIDAGFNICPHCGFDRTHIKKSGQWMGAKGGWT